MYVPAVKRVEDMSKQNGDDSPVLVGMGYLCDFGRMYYIYKVFHYLHAASPPGDKIVSDCATSDIENLIP